MALSRRQFLGLSAGSLALGFAGRARAIGDASRFRIGQLAIGDGWQPRPTALPRLAREIDKRTSIDVSLSPKALSANARDLHETPFLYLAGDREFPIPQPRDIERLRRFLTFGGFLFIDSAEGSIGGAFHGSVARLTQALFPKKPLSIVPKSHVVYKSFYLLDRPYGRLSLASTMEGVTLDGRLTIAYAQNDLGGAWARDDFGNWEFSCEPGGERQREHAFRMGINLVMYALCLDYKADQVHVESIMRRRPWRPNDGAEVP